MLESKGRLGLATLACVGLAIAISTPVAAWERGSVENFTVPAGKPMMEGLTVGRDGNVYVSTFDPLMATGLPAQVLTFNQDGQLLKTVNLHGATTSTAMLGLAFRPNSDTLYVLDFGLGNLLQVDPGTGFTTLCMTGFGTGPGLNALTFDAAGGNVYISDSFQGIIWTNATPNNICSTPTPFVPANALLLPDDGVPGFGANGVEFNNDHSAMFVCNTAFDWIVKIDVSGGTAGKPQMFTNSINGCDGIAIDKSNNIWAAANQADEIVVVNPSGKVIAKLGDFDGVSGGATQGLLFPASPAFSKDGQSLFVTNLELDLRTITVSKEHPDGIQTVDSQWAAMVKQHSIAKLEAQIPQQSGNGQ
jgi:sugar lactone lactonase YvrE